MKDELEAKVAAAEETIDQLRSDTAKLQKDLVCLSVCLSVCLYLCLSVSLSSYLPDSHYCSDVVCWRLSVVEVCAKINIYAFHSLVG